MIGSHMGSHSGGEAGPLCVQGMGLMKVRRENKCSAFGMTDSTEGSLHHFPLRDGLQAKDTSHSYSMTFRALDF